MTVDALATIMNDIMVTGAYRTGRVLLPKMRHVRKHTGGMHVQHGVRGRNVAGLPPVSFCGLLQ